MADQKLNLLRHFDKAKKTRNLSEMKIDFIKAVVNKGGVNGSNGKIRKMITRNKKLARLNKQKFPNTNCLFEDKLFYSKQVQ